MFAHFAIALFISFVAIESNEGHPCQCYPDRMSGQTFFRSRKMNDFYIDYNLQKIVEEYHGVSAFDKIVYDLKKEMRYTFRSDGSCTSFLLTNAENYDQCLPAGAVKTDEDSDSVTFSYKLEDKTVVKALNKETCFPISVTKSKGKRSLALTYTDVTSDFDGSVFNVDLSDCNSSVI